jgi:hypothetical protein
MLAPTPNTTTIIDSKVNSRELLDIVANKMRAMARTEKFEMNVKELRRLFRRS